jgi:hypothetical protein
MRDGSLRRAANRRLVRQERAQGILLAALGVLAGHFGYDRAA